MRRRSIGAGVRGAVNAWGRAYPLAVTEKERGSHCPGSAVDVEWAADVPERILARFTVGRQVMFRPSLGDLKLVADALLSKLMVLGELIGGASAATFEEETDQEWSFAAQKSHCELDFGPQSFDPMD